MPSTLFDLLPGDTSASALLDRFLAYAEGLGIPLSSAPG